MSNEDSNGKTHYSQHKEQFDRYRSKVLRFTFQLSLQDGEVREWFERQPNKGAYLKRLILEDKARVLNGRDEYPPLTPADCKLDDCCHSLVGKVVAIMPSVLAPEYRSATHQIVLVTGGIGAGENTYGGLCSCINLYSGKRIRWKRNDIIGEVKAECLPEWAKERCSTIQREQVRRKDKEGREER